MNHERKRKLIAAALEMGARATSYTAHSRLQADLVWGEQLFRRAARAQLAAFRLFRMAGL